MADPKVQPIFAKKSNPGFLTKMTDLREFRKMTDIAFEVGIR